MSTHTYKPGDEAILRAGPVRNTVTGTPLPGPQITHDTRVRVLENFNHEPPTATPYRVKAVDGSQLAGRDTLYVRGEDLTPAARFKVGDRVVIKAGTPVRRDDGTPGTGRAYGVVSVDTEACVETVTGKPLPYLCKTIDGQDFPGLTRGSFWLPESDLHPAPAESAAEPQFKVGDYVLVKAGTPVRYDDGGRNGNAITEDTVAKVTDDGRSGLLNYECQTISRQPFPGRLSSRYYFPASDLHPAPAEPVVGSAEPVVGSAEPVVGFKVGDHVVVTGNNGNTPNHFTHPCRGVITALPRVSRNYHVLGTNPDGSQISQFVDPVDIKPCPLKPGDRATLLAGPVRNTRTGDRLPCALYPDIEQDTEVIVKLHDPEACPGAPFLVSGKDVNHWARGVDLIPLTEPAKPAKLAAPRFKLGDRVVFDGKHLGTFLRYDRDDDGTELALVWLDTGYTVPQEVSPDNLTLAPSQFKPGEAVWLLDNLEQPCRHLSGYGKNLCIVENVSLTAAANPVTLRDGGGLHYRADDTRIRRA